MHSLARTNDGSNSAAALPRAIEVDGRCKLDLVMRATIHAGSQALCAPNAARRISHLVGAGAFVMDELIRGGFNSGPARGHARLATRRENQATARS